MFHQLSQSNTACLKYKKAPLARTDNLESELFPSANIEIFKLLEHKLNLFTCFECRFAQERATAASEGIPFMAIAATRFYCFQLLVSHCRLPIHVS